MPEDLRLASALETVLYYASDQQDDMKRFYENVFGLVAAVCVPTGCANARPT